MEFYAARIRRSRTRVAHHSPHSVRIIGGRCRGRVVRFPPASALRPTPDRVRETLFNWLGQDLTGRVTLEPYAGSGVLSLEALSRGATRAVALDRDPKAVAAIVAHASLFGLAGLDVRRGDARAFLESDPGHYDVVFLDPPFADDPWPWLLPLAGRHLAAGGVLYAEAGRPLAAPPGLALARSGTAGRVYYHLLRPEPGPPVEPAG
jgi:16S rRNA (guanine(966)-N(2))-methyltransferase RsmD